jgi:hypothetical protein
MREFPTRRAQLIDQRIELRRVGLIIISDAEALRRATRFLFPLRISAATLGRRNI